MFNNDPWLKYWTVQDALAKLIVLCSWERHFSRTVPFSTQLFNGYQPIECCRVTQGVKIFIVASCYGNWDKFQLYNLTQTFMPCKPYNLHHNHHLVVK